MLKVTYLTRDFRTVGSSHNAISALCGVLVHIFLIGLQSDCHWNDNDNNCCWDHGSHVDVTLRNASKIPMLSANLQTNSYVT